MARKFLKKIVKRQLKKQKKLLRNIKKNILIGGLYTNKSYGLRAVKSSQVKNNTIDNIKFEPNYKRLNNVQFLITGDPIIIKFICYPMNIHSMRYKVAIPILLNEECYMLFIDDNSFYDGALQHIK